MSDPTHVRTAAKAIIVRDGYLLAIKCQRDEDVFYILPGGGKEPGEDLVACLRRECLEEIGVDVEVGPLRYVRDYIGRNHELAAIHGHVHALELMFDCTLVGKSLRGGSVPDDLQIGVEWLPLALIDQYPLMPHALRARIGAWEQAPGPIYLGDVR